MIDRQFCQSGYFVLIINSQIKFPSILMLQQLISTIKQELSSKPFIKLQSVVRMYPNITSSQALRQLMISVQTSNVDFELICFITIEKENLVLMSYDRWSNIAKGYVFTELANFEEKIGFEKEQMKQFKMIGFCKKDLPLSELKESITTSTTNKKHKYVNRQLLFLKKAKTPNAGKNMQSQESKRQNQSKESTKIQNVDNRNSKPKMQENRPKPLQKRATKELNSAKETPPPTINVSNKNQAESVKENSKRILKMNIQSDQEYYQKDQFNKMMDLEPGRQTDCSGKKKEQEEMREANKPLIHMSKFIQDEDEEDEDLFAKMEKAPKKEEVLQEKTLKNQQKVIPQNSQKIQNQVKKANVGQPIPQKGGLMSWLNKK